MILSILTNHFLKARAIDLKRKYCYIIKYMNQIEEKEIKKIREGKLNDFLPVLDIEEMLKAGLHFGHKTSKCHPKMKPYLEGVRNTIHIINLLKTKEKFEEALKFIYQLISENKVLLLVGTKVQAKDMIKEVAKECQLPYVSERWIGGTFTNFETILKRINYFNDLEKKIEEGHFEQYTKKEKANFRKELERLKANFEGLRDLKKIPDAIFVLDISKEKEAVKEARKKGVKIVGVADTNSDPSLVDFPIPANDEAVSSIKYIMDKLKEVILKAKNSLKQEKKE
jgi:small subunit ribosomal protein S2